VGKQGQAKGGEDRVFYGVGVLVGRVEEAKEEKKGVLKSVAKGKPQHLWKKGSAAR